VCLSHAPKAEQQASDMEALPEHAEVERQEPERGLTYEVNRRAEGTSELNRRLGGGAECCYLRLLRCWRLWLGLGRKASKQGVLEPCPEGRAAGQRHGSAAGARGRGMWKPERGLTYEVNRRAEGTSELNRRLGGGAECCYLRPLRCWRLWPGQCQKASAKCPLCSLNAEQQADNREAPPEHAEVERKKPERGLTYEVNRRAEGTSELNRRLGCGAGCCCLRPLRCWRLWPGPRRKASASPYFAPKAEQQADNRAAPPEHEGVECRNQSEA